MKRYLVNEKEQCATSFFRFRHLQLLAIVVTLTTLLFFPYSRIVSAETNTKIQELNAFIEGGRGVVYTLSNVKKGDRLYAYMKNASGNLDPMLGI